MESTVKGKILKGVGGLYTVSVLSDTVENKEIRCRARGSFRHDRLTPLAGDNVILSYDEKAADDDGKFVIDEIVDRKNALIRPPMANLDYLFVTMATASPAPILSTVDKLICIAEHNGIEPVVVVTKSELSPTYADELVSLYEGAGIRSFAVGYGMDGAVAALKVFIDREAVGKISAFAGASGVGKSTLMNTLFPQLSLETGEISHRIERGKNTTRHVELYPLSKAADCGFLADTPGFTMLDFERFDFMNKEELPDAFREFRPYIGECRYRKCTHVKEDGCAIVGAVKDGRIARSRHKSFVSLYEILKKKTTY